jgi:Cu+-exporting ATPase
MQALEVPLGGLEARAIAYAEAGKTPIYVAIAGRLAAVIAVADAVKHTSAAAIKALHGLGKTVAMISGDTERTARALARELSVDHVVAEVLPDGKVAALEELRAKVGKVAFVGDGINDAPALAAADVGIAIGTGTDVAIEAADVVLMAGDVDGVVTGFDLSRKVMRNIKQNLFWAFGYNVALIPVAAGILVPFGGPALSPMLGAGAMALSSVFVLTNALRLRRIQPAFGASKTEVTA